MLTILETSAEVVQQYAVVAHVSRTQCLLGVPRVRRVVTILVGHAKLQCEDSLPLRIAGRGRGKVMKKDRLFGSVEMGEELLL